MVVMRGLPFNVSLQDILNFYHGFPEVRPSYTTIILSFQSVYMVTVFKILSYFTIKFILVCDWTSMTQLSNISSPPCL